MTYSRDERAALCRLLEEVGPDAPTLCAGWTAHDLAAHLVVRERRLDSDAGLVLSALAGWTERVRLEAAGRPFAQLVEEVRSGPPAWSPFALPVVEPLVNTTEYFVHHEDVRRAQDGWEPRDLPAEFTEMLWRRLRADSRRFFRKVPVGVNLRRPDGLTAPAKSGAPGVELVGEPAELMLYAFGRRDQALVTLEGEPAAVEGLQHAALGI